MGLWAAAVALVLYATLRTSTAIVEDFQVSIQYGSHTSEELLSRFGVEQGGLVSAHVEVEPPGLAYIGMYPQDEWDRWHDTAASASQAAVMLCTFPSTMRYEINGEGGFNHTVSIEDLYTVRAVRCQTGDSVTVTGRLTVTNPSQGEEFKHLSLTESPLPPLLLSIAWAYVIYFVAFGVALIRFRDTVMPFQYGFVVMVVTKLVEVSLRLRHFTQLGDSGDDKGSLETLANVASAFSVASLLLVLLLTALGWTLTRPSISTKEVVSIGLLFSGYLALVFMQSLCSSDDNCGALLLGEYIVRSLLMLAIIVALNYNVTHLRIMLNDNTWSPSTPLSYIKLSLFQHFRWAFLAFLLLPTMLLVIRVAVLSWRFDWVIVALEEGFLIAFYGNLCWVFRPRKYDTYDVVGQVLDRATQAPPTVTIAR